MNSFTRFVGVNVIEDLRLRLDIDTERTYSLKKHPEDRRNSPKSAKSWSGHCV